MEIKILTNYDDELYCVECKEKIKLLDKFAVKYETDVYGEFEKTYHLDCLPTEDDIYYSIDDDTDK